jgi:hypothetical protein
MPRNAGRLNAPQNDSVEAVTENKSSIFDFVTPTEFVDLPTKGRFYPENHPLHNVDTIEIRHMTAKETDILSSQSLLKKGLAIDRMIENVIVDSEIKVKDLFVGDKNAIIVACRVNGFGPSYETKITCGSCGAKNEEVFDLGEVEVKSVDEEIVISEQGTFVITLPKSNVDAECRLVNGADEQKMLKLAEKKKKLNLPDTSLTDQLKILIVSLNGETDRGLVEKFVDVMPAFDASYFRKHYEKAVPNVDMSHNFVCPSCDANTVIDIPFSANFFWPE